jgi:hypothetical protein
MKKVKQIFRNPYFWVMVWFLIMTSVAIIANKITN